MASNDNGPRLSEPVFERLLHGRAFSLARYAVPVLSLDRNGWPHVAMVSGVCLNDQGTTLSFPLRRHTRTWNYANTQGKLTLLITVPEVVVYMKGTAKLLAVPTVSSNYDVCQLHIQDVIDDNRPGVVVDGLTYRFVGYDAEESEERQVFHWICKEMTEPHG